MKIVWSPTARRKIDEIVDYISADNLDAAVALVESFEERVEHLKKNPRSGRTAPALNDEMVREIVAHPNYIVVYESKNSDIVILTIRHSKQDEDDSDIKPK